MLVTDRFKRLLSQYVYCRRILGVLTFEQSNTTNKRIAFTSRNRFPPKKEQKHCYRFSCNGLSLDAIRSHPPFPGNSTTYFYINTTRRYSFQPTPSFITSFATTAFACIKQSSSFILSHVHRLAIASPSSHNSLWRSYRAFPSPVFH